MRGARSAAGPSGLVGARAHDEQDGARMHAVAGLRGRSPVCYLREHGHDRVIVRLDERVPYAAVAAVALDGGRPADDAAGAVAPLPEVEEHAPAAGELEVPGARWGGCRYKLTCRCDEEEEGGRGASGRGRRAQGGAYFSLS